MTLRLTVDSVQNNTPEGAILAMLQIDADLRGTTPDLRLSDGGIKMEDSGIQGKALYVWSKKIPS